MSQCHCSAAVAVAGIRAVAECLGAVAVPPPPLQVSERWLSVSVPLQCRRRRCRYASGGRVSQCHCSVAAVAGIRAVAECLSAVAVPPPPLQVSERWPSVSVPLQCRRRRCGYPSGGRVSQCRCSAAAVAGIRAVAECLSADAVLPPPLRVSERWPSVSVPLQCCRRCRYPSGG